jgi:hypothetical protein
VAPRKTKAKIREIGIETEAQREKALAKEEARAAARENCDGDCPTSAKKCKYLEKKISIAGREERPNPEHPNETQYRYEYKSEGTCQCE